MKNDMSIVLRNNSSFVEQKGDTYWWNWTAYVECAAPDSLTNIDYVEYHLHPTFRNPIRRIRQHEGGFPLKASGWGVFELRAKIVFKDKHKKPMMLKHVLEFVDAED